MAWKVTAMDVRMAAALAQAGIVDVLTGLLRIDPREARARVSRAVDLGPRRALTGEPLEPLLPVTAEAVAAGAVSAAQAEVIVDSLERELDGGGHRVVGGDPRFAGRPPTGRRRDAG